MMYYVTFSTVKSDQPDRRNASRQFVLRHCMITQQRVSSYGTNRTSKNSENLDLPCTTPLTNVFLYTQHATQFGKRNTPALDVNTKSPALHVRQRGLRSNGRGRSCSSGCHRVHGGLCKHIGVRQHAKCRRVARSIRVRGWRLIDWLQ